MYCWPILDPDLGTIRCRFFGNSRSEALGPPTALYHGTVGEGRSCGAPYTQMYCTMTEVIACCAYNMTHIPDQRAKNYDWGGGAINWAASPAASISPRHCLVFSFMAFKV